MNKMKKFAVILVCTMMVGILGGCASFDASAYIKALLDNSYKNDSTGIVEQKIGTAEEAAAIYEQGIDSEMAAFGDLDDMSPEILAEYRQMMMDIFAMAKYTVGESSKQDDGSYVVTVTYEQMQVFGPAMDAYMIEMEAMLTDMMETAMAGGETPSDEELADAVYRSLLDCMNEVMANVTYAEPATTTIRVELEDKVYTPNETDIVNLESMLFDLDALNQQ